MELKDIKEGDYIVEVLDNDDTFLNLVGRDKKPKYFINVTVKKFISNPPSKMYKQKVLRYATPQEKQWLDACIESKRYISFEDINVEPVYEIY